MPTLTGLSFNFYNLNYFPSGRILNGKDVEQLAEQLAEQQQLDKRDFED